MGFLDSIKSGFKRKLEKAPKEVKCPLCGAAMYYVSGAAGPASGGDFSFYPEAIVCEKCGATFPRNNPKDWKNQ